MATTPCPSCRAPIRVRGERAACPACGTAVRFVDAPEVPCPACAGAVPLLPGKDAARCPACGTWAPREAGRAVVGQATCPRCRRRIEVPLDGDEAACPHCGSRLALQGTL